MFLLTTTKTNLVFFHTCVSVGEAVSLLRDENSIVSAARYFSNGEANFIASWPFHSPHV